MRSRTVDNVIRRITGHVVHRLSDTDSSFLVNWQAVFSLPPPTANYAVKIGDTQFTSGIYIVLNSRQLSGWFTKLIAATGSPSRFP